MTSQIPSEQNLAVPEETQRRSQVVLQALPVLLIPAISAIATALLVSLVLRTTIRLAAAQAAHSASRRHRHHRDGRVSSRR